MLSALGRKAIRPTAARPKPPGSLREQVDMLGAISNVCTPVAPLEPIPISKTRPATASASSKTLTHADLARLAPWARGLKPWPEAFDTGRYRKGDPTEVLHGGTMAAHLEQLRRANRPMETIRLLAMLRTMSPASMRRLVDRASQTELNALNRVLRAWLGEPRRRVPRARKEYTLHLLVAYRNKAQRTPL